MEKTSINSTNVGCLNEQCSSGEEMTTEKRNGSGLRALISRVIRILSWIFTSQVFIHLLLLGKQAILAAFGLIGPISLKHIDPFVFACGRIFLICLTAPILAVLFDSHWWFKKSSYNKARAVEEDDRDCMWPFSLIRIPEWQDSILLLICGALMTWSSFSYVLAVKWTPFTIVAILQPTMSAFACTFSVLLGREGISIPKALGVVLAVAGSIGTLLTVTLVDKNNSHKNPGQYSMAQKVIGALLELSNSIVLALYLVIQKTLLNRGMPPVTFVSWAFAITFGFSIMGSAYFFRFVSFSTIPLQAWLGLLYGGLIIGTLSYVIGSFASKHTSPTIVAIYTTTAPIYSAVFMYVFRGETTTWWTVPSGIAIGVGVILVAVGKQRENAKEKKKAILKTEDSESAQEESTEEQRLLDPDNNIQNYRAETTDIFGDAEKHT